MYVRGDTHKALYGNKTSENLWTTCATFVLVSDPPCSALGL